MGLKNKLTEKVKVDITVFKECSKFNRENTRILNGSYDVVNTILRFKMTLL